MGQTLAALHKLQGVERQLAAIRNQADVKRRQIRQYQKALEKQEADVEQRKTAIRDSQMEIDRLDLNVKSKDEHLEKHREALNRAKTNKEYAAILTTINTEKADNAKMEGRQLQLMTELDDVRAQSQAVIAERDRLFARVAEAERELEALLQRTAPEVARLEKMRADAAQTVPPSLLVTFTRIAEHHEGEAMAEIVVQNAKRNEYGCGGCNMSVTLEQVLGIQSRDDLQVCGSCGMILYWDHARGPLRS